MNHARGMRGEFRRKRALKPQQVWAIRFFLDQHRRLRDRALFDFAMDSKLRGCGVVKVRIGDIVAGGRIRGRAIMVQLELVEPARKTLIAWLERRAGRGGAYVFPRRNDHMDQMSTRQYARPCGNRSPVSACKRRTTALTRFAEQRHRSSMRRRTVRGPCRSCLAMQRSRAPCVISASMWKTRWSWQSARRSDPA